jgi:hypothetical protein
MWYFSHGYISYVLVSWDNLVGSDFPVGWSVWALITGSGKGFSVFQDMWSGYSSHLASCWIITGSLATEGKAGGTWNWVLLLLLVQVRNEWTYTCTPFMACTGTAFLLHLIFLDTTWLQKKLSVINQQSSPATIEWKCSLDMKIYMRHVNIETLVITFVVSYFWYCQEMGCCVDKESSMLVPKYLLFVRALSWLLDWILSSHKCTRHRWSSSDNFKSI